MSRAENASDQRGLGGESSWTRTLAPVSPAGSGAAQMAPVMSWCSRMSEGVPGAGDRHACDPTCGGNRRDGYVVSMSASGHGLFRAEHRGLRELHAATRHLSGHWEKLAGRLDGQVGTVLRGGAATGRELLAALEAETQARGLESFPAAHGAGSRAAGPRNSAGHPLLERNQAARGAVLDAQHVSTLLGYLGRLATARGDEPLAAFHTRWEQRIRTVEEQARTAAIELGREPADPLTPPEQGA